MHWQTTRFRIDLSRPQVMGIVNVTPDSFFDGGRLATTAAAIAHCEQLLADGAQLLDIGGESTRPGSKPVPADEELARVLPVLEAALRLGCPVSVDTTKAEVMAAVLARGADIVNDVNALQAPGALDVVAAHASCGVCLMHMRGTPEAMQLRPRYDDVVDEVGAFLRERVAEVVAHGVAAERIVLDPGIGFGKSVEHNIALLRRQRELLALGRPLLLGWSRKSTLGAITGRGVGQRQAASVAAALAAVQSGARIVRVHDVAATVDALKVWQVAGLAHG
ncbi:MAG: dihydropteroate synthase [Burkholderiales bacterium]|nr:dihydropteroate synthase [Burkholderiales bacterium]